MTNLEVAFDEFVKANCSPGIVRDASSWYWKIFQAGAEAQRRAVEPKAPLVCPIHGERGMCKAEKFLGDPRTAVVFGPFTGAQFQPPYAATTGWFCTKHGAIAYQDCEQCKAERTK